MKNITMELGMIEHCAPTLAGMKTASLFSYFHSGEEIVLEELGAMNRLMNPKGIYVEIMRWNEGSALIYVYRKTALERDLGQKEIRELLRWYGYRGNSIDAYLSHLQKRLLCCACFPHEIGVFLGYPVEDVIGFIENNGKNCESCGLWKVYGNREEKDLLFQKLRKCSDVYLQVFGSGRKLSQMIV